MPICTFFGHRDAPKDVEPLLRLALKEMIEDKGVDCFYVGNQGSFDYMVGKILKEMKITYPHIRYAIVLAYRPANRNAMESVQAEYENTLYPIGLEKVPTRFAILHRNKWMLERADYVITYVRYVTAGASQFKKMAEKKRKVVVNLIP